MENSKDKSRLRLFDIVIVFWVSILSLMLLVNTDKTETLWDVAEIQTEILQEQAYIFQMHTEILAYILNDSNKQEFKLNEIWIEDLKQFIKQDKTNENIYSEIYDCDSFVFDFIKNLNEYGYLSYPVYIEYEDNAHSIVSVYTKEYGMVYIDPQFDDIIYNLDVGDYYYNDKILKINNIEGIKIYKNETRE